jgi:hypothetical protein
MRYAEITEASIEEATATGQTVRLTDLYDESELTDPSEFLHNYIDEDDLERDFMVFQMTPQEARAYQTARDDMSVFDAFRQFASKAQKQLVKDKRLRYDTNRIIVVINKTVVDGNHQLVAGILAKQPIKYIDLAS